MDKKRLVLKGSLHGTKKIAAYKNPDIINSIVDNRLCLMNKFSITYLDDKKRFYIYHSYYSLDENMKINHSGRWYTLDYQLDNKDLNEKDKTFSIELKSVEWYDEDTATLVKKDVRIKIQLTPPGFNKLQKFLLSSTNNS
jgi:hypothetical protein